MQDAVTAETGPRGPMGEAVSPAMPPSPRMTDALAPEKPPEPRATGADPYRAALKSLRPAILTVAGFSLAINLLMLTGSVYMLQVYDRVLSSGSVPTLLGLFAIVVVLYGFLGLYDALRARMLSRAGMRLDRALGAPAFRGWLRAGLDGQAGQERSLRDLDTLRGFAASPAAAIPFDLPFVPLFLAVLFLLHPWLGWATVAGACIAGAIAFAGRVLTGAALTRAAGADATERELTAASRTGAETAVAMGMEEALHRRWQALHDRSLAAGQEGADPAATLAATSKAFRMLLQSAILTLGAWLVLRGEISAGMIIASSILSGRALAPIDQLTGQWKSLSRAAEAHKRMKGFSAARTAAPEQIALPEPKGRLTVRGLTRLMPERPGAALGTAPAADRPKILSDVSFDLEPGEALGVIGASASGKSTLARALVGVLPPDAGEVRLDGATLDQYGAARLGRHVGYLPQRVDLLPGTVRDNIARFDPEAPDAAVIAAAQAAGVHQMILALPEGYQTRLGGADQPLSGGQVQRLGLARALYGMPALVVLDEPNSNLDQAGEAALSQAIAALRAAGSAVVVMAHRASALAAVNKLLLLDKGQVARFGDKAEVLAALTQAAQAAAKSAAVTRVRPTIRPVPSAADTEQNPPASPGRRQAQ